MNPRLEVQPTDTLEVVCFKVSTALTPAVAVAKAQAVDLESLQAWAKRIAEEAAFADFLRRFNLS